MPNVDELIYEFLSRDGVSSLSKALLTKVNSRIQERIVSVVDENSDENHVPSAAAVYTAINKMSHIKFKTHTGSMDEVTEPNSSYIYLQRDDSNDNTWMMYVHDEELGWINIGDTEIDLSNYWSKNADDVEALKLALGISEEITRLEERINERIDNVEAEIKETIANLPANLLFNENGDFAIKLRAAMNTSLVDYMFTLERPGMYTIYAERGCPDNPFSAVNSSFRGICHITQLEKENQQMYGWIMLFDQEGNAYTNYIRRSEASGWVCLNDKSLVEEVVTKFDLKLEDYVKKSDLVKLTEDEINSAVDEAYTATSPNL